MTVLPYRPRQQKSAQRAPQPPTRPHPAVRLAVGCAMFPFVCTGWACLVVGLTLLNGAATVHRWVDPNRPRDGAGFFTILID